VDNGTFALRQQVEQLYIEHHHWLTTLLRRRLGNSIDTADLLQDIFLKLIRRGVVPSAAESRCHLSQIAKGLVIDLYRRRRLEAHHLEGLREHSEPLAPSEEVRALALECLAQVDRTLHAQPPKAREALLLHRLAGMPHRQIAAELNVSVSSVEKYIAASVRACSVHA
jgi:RNA polymerase sigma-70 factor (ECF subfamily)